MQSTKSYAIFLISLMITGILSLSPAISSLMNTSQHIITSTGRIGNEWNVTAKSGSAQDIQTAVDEVVAAGGGNVHIPMGTWNFVEVGEPWTTVYMDLASLSGVVTIRGAPTERDANDQVIEWKTVLVMPYEAPDLETWFHIDDDGRPFDGVRFRFTDIKLIGWRYYDLSSETTYYGIQLHNIQNFRVDHCHFQDMCESAVQRGSHQLHEYNEDVASGVIDHNIMVNTYGDSGFPGGPRYNERTLGYGIGGRLWASEYWAPLESVIGQYTPRTVFIEDNYISKWRHGAYGNDGMHYVYRHNTVENSYGNGEVDSHGSYATAQRPYAVGTRAIEIYENTFRDVSTYAPPGAILPDKPFVINHRGGSAIAFNNTMDNTYYTLFHLNNDDGNLNYVPQCRIADTYVWNNDLGGGTWCDYFWQVEENVHYFLRAPSLAEDGWEYTPYPYPHPLTLEATP